MKRVKRLLRLRTLPAAVIALAGLSCSNSTAPQAEGPPSSQPAAAPAAGTADAPAGPAQGGASRPVRPSAAANSAAVATPSPRPRSKALQDAPAKTPDGVAIDDKARSLLARMIEAYQQARTYQDDSEFRIVHYLQSGPLSVRFERPNKVDAHLANVHVVSDGKQQTVDIDELHQHVTGSAPETLSADRIYGDAIPSDMVSPIGTVSVPLKLMLAENPWKYVLEDVVAVSVDPEPAIIDGAAHDVIRLDKVTSDAVLYLNRQTGLIRRLEVDLTGALLAQGQPAVGRVVYTLEMRNAQVGAAQKPFSPVPPADSKEVKAFEFPGAPASSPTDEPAEPSVQKDDHGQP